MNLQNWVFSAFFLGVLGLVVLMAWPFVTALIFAGMLAGSFLPVYRFGHVRLKLGRYLCATVVCLLIVLLVVIPCVYIVAKLAGEVRAVYLHLKGSLDEEVITGFLFGEGPVAGHARQVAGYVGIDYNYETIRGYVIEIGQAVSLAALEQLNAILSDVLVFSFQFVMMMLFVFSLLVYGPDLKTFLFDLSPLRTEDEQLLIDRFNQMNYVTLVANGLGGLIQGGLAGISFWLAGIDSVLLWTVLMIVLAFIPLIGISFVYLPACIYLVANGRYLAAGLIFAWCALVSFFTENWFKSIFVGNQVKVSSLLVLFSIVGGMAVFGAAGIFYGPLVITLFLTFVDLYHERYVPRASISSDS